jgi:hypothetical protein
VKPVIIWFCKMLGNSSEAERLVASHEGLNCMVLVSYSELCLPLTRLAYSGTMEAERVCTFEISVNFYHTTLRHNTEDNYQHKGLISDTVCISFGKADNFNEISEIYL